MRLRLNKHKKIREWQKSWRPSERASGRKSLGKGQEIEWATFCATLNAHLQALESLFIQGVAAKILASLETSPPRGRLSGRQARGPANKWRAGGRASERASSTSLMD